MNELILIVDDDATTLDLVSMGLEAQGFRVETAVEGTQALEKAADTDFDVVLTDVQMPGMSGIELCRALSAIRADLPVLVMTGHASMDVAVAALRNGAYDFITKPFELDTLQHHLDRALEHHRLKREVTSLRRRVRAQSSSGGLIGESRSMRELRDLIERVAATDVTVLLRGESGTGKEVSARAIHNASSRADGPFVAVNCAALPDSLLESELFGHERGAFTDAKTARRGLFLEADGGTLLLDEIGEMPLPMQAKLLRALQERVVRPVGGDRTRPFDTRIIAATNIDIESAVETNDFRQDLYYRLNVVEIEVDPLRARDSDVLLLAQHFLSVFSEKHGVSIAGMSKEAAQALTAYDWPGNVRELMNAVERAVALARFDELQVADLPRRLQEFQPTSVTFDASSSEGFITLEALERRYVTKVLAASDNNKSLAAETLGIDRKTLHRKLKRWGADAG